MFLLVDRTAVSKSAVPRQNKSTHLRNDILSSQHKCSKKIISAIVSQLRQRDLKEGKDLYMY